MKGITYILGLIGCMAVLVSAGCSQQHPQTSNGSNQSSPSMQIDPEEVQVESHGWRLVRISGSHHIFAKDGESPLSIPVHRNKVKPCYGGEIKKACKKRE